MLKQTLAVILAALLSASVVARAAEDQATKQEPPVQKEEPKKKVKKVRPHRHDVDAKQGAEPVQSATSGSGEAKKPLHNHQQEHK